MTRERITTRADLIALVAHRKTLPPAVARACMTGQVEVLGAFEEIPPSGVSSGWILTITAKHGTVFYVAVIPEPNFYYQIYLLTEIPWHLWMGKPLAGARYSVYQGDHPAAYDARRDSALMRLKK